MNFPAPEDYFSEKFYQFIDAVVFQTTRILDCNGLFSVSVSAMTSGVDVSKNIVKVPFLLNGTNEENKQALDILMPKMKNTVRCHNGFIVEGNYLAEDPQIFQK